MGEKKKKDLKNTWAFFPLEIEYVFPQSALISFYFENQDALKMSCTKRKQDCVGSVSYETSWDGGGGGPKTCGEATRQEWAPWSRQEEQLKLDDNSYLEYFSTSLF